jgi:lipopolysaccharide/colanic/teichoic acid biosynthesis glycosyltransferase
MQLYRKRGFYERVVKRLLDLIAGVLTVLVFGWLYVIVALVVRIVMGKPVLFKQPRPGMIDPKTGRERIFDMYKFRTMTDERDENGRLLPDEQRLGKFGRALRATSLDELPELINILRGDMSVIGPRPQLVRDMTFMSMEQRMRHTAKPGLSGLAQVMGRNAISWDKKLDYDLQYIQRISLWNDLKILALTVRKVFIRSHLTESSEEIDVTDDFGDYLLKNGRVTQEDYDRKQAEARRLLAERKKR